MDSRSDETLPADAGQLGRGVMAQPQGVRALLDACRAAAEAAESAAARHLAASQQQEGLARELKAQLRELEEARSFRRRNVTLRWRWRQQAREARALLSSAAPLRVAGKAPGLRTNARARAEELVNSWWQRAAPLPRGLGASGVYALFDGGELVYIGQAVNVATRVGQHFASKQFTAASFIAVPVSDLDRVERLLLDVFMPPLNKDPTTRALRLALRHNEKGNRPA